MMDKKKAAQARAVLVKVIKDNEAVFRENKLQLSVKSGSYGDNYATFKVECLEIKTDGSVVTKEATDYKLGCSLLGLEEGWLGRTFEDDKGESITIEGLKSGNKKYPVIVTKSMGGGGSYKMTVEGVLRWVKAHENQEPLFVEKSTKERSKAELLDDIIGGLK